MIKKFKNLSFTGGALAFVVVLSSSVMGLPAHATTPAPVTPTSTVNTSSATNVPSQATNAQSNAQAKIATAKLKSCQNREAAIDTIMTRIQTRAQNQLNLFSTIATRVEAFYTKSGKTFANYPTLVADVNAAQAQAQTDFSTLKTNSNFSCSSSDPKGTVLAFQGYLKLEISDLQNFRTSVKNLIVGVASANGVTVSTNAGSTTSTTGGN